MTDAEVLDQWDRHNRAAIVQCSEWPSMVISYEELVTRPKETIFELGEFVEAVRADRRSRRRGGDRVRRRAVHQTRRPSRTDRSVQGQYRVLAQVLDQLDGIHFE